MRPPYFNSRLCERPTVQLPPSVSPISQFQFTPLREGRPGMQMSQVPCKRISIHAPARGATDLLDMLDLDALFQFTPLHEGRREAAARIYTISQFQFTPLHEGRHTTRDKLFLPSIFQFTPLRDGRPMAERCFPLDNIFQFTPLREGRRPPGCARLRCLRISIHAPTRGATVPLP